MGIVEADSEDPDLIIDAATLTGASRIAVGQELQSMFSNRKVLGEDLEEISWQVDDPLWHMPLYKGYKKYIHGKLGDIRNTGTGGSGVITAALYLQEFLKPTRQFGKYKQTPWVHIDLNGYNIVSRPGRPEGVNLKESEHFTRSLRNDLQMEQYVW